MRHGVKNKKKKERKQKGDAQKRNRSDERRCRWRRCRGRVLFLTRLRRRRFGQCARQTKNNKPSLRRGDIYLFFFFTRPPPEYTDFWLVNGSSLSGFIKSKGARLPDRMIDTIGGFASRRDDTPTSAAIASYV